MKKRHSWLAIMFFLIVLTPTALTVWYLYTRAADQYASVVGFTVRSEDVTSASDLLGGLGSSLGSSSANDSDILYEFIRSQELVSKVDAALDLRSLYSRHRDVDPLLSYNPEGTIEDLADFWRRMVRVSYDTGSGLIELRALAFTPEEAQLIAKKIFAESTATINALSSIARNDATRYANEDLNLALERLKSAREMLTAFRLKNEIVDPNADIQAQMGLLNGLLAQQTEALINLDLITSTTNSNDPRLKQVQRRVDVIELRIAEERAKFGIGGGSAGVEYAKTVSEFERLVVDREFAETAYAAALSALDTARAEANRQSRYLAAYIQPTLAEKSEFPQRELMVLLVLLFSFLTWAILSLVYYSLRDRR